MALPIDWDSDVGGVLNVLLDSPVDADIDEADEDEEDAHQLQPSYDSFPGLSSDVRNLTHSA